MKNDYYDIPMTLNIIIAVSATSEEEAMEKLYAMEDAEVVQLLQERSGFINEDFTSATSH
jgi:hypothetical protein